MVDNSFVELLTLSFKLGQLVLIGLNRSKVTETYLELKCLNFDWYIFTFRAQSHFRIH